MTETELVQLPVVGPLLRRLGVKSLEDLHKLDLNKISGMMGVGTSKMKMLRKLMDEQAEDTGVIEEFILEDSAVESVEPTEFDNLEIATTLRSIPMRIKNKIENYGLITIKDLQTFHDTVDVLEESNYGRGTHRILKEILGTLKNNGVNYSKYRSNNIPKSSTELFNNYFDGLPDDRTRGVFEARYVKSQTLQQIGDSLNPPLTRERVRQILQRQLKEDQPIYASLCASYIDPIKEILTNRTPIYGSQEALKVSNTNSIAELVFISDLSGLELHVYSGRGAGLIGVLDWEEFKKLRSEVIEYVDVDEVGDEIGNIVKLFDDMGLDVTESECQTICEALLNTVKIGDKLIKNTRHKAIYWEETLRDCNKPMNVRDFMAKMSERYPDESVTLHNTSVHFHRNPRIFKSSHHDYIHEDNYWVPRNTLDIILDEYRKMIPKDGTSVSIKLLSRNVDHKGYGISPYTIRDLLVQSGEYRSWRATCEVAYKNLEGTSRKNVQDLIYEVAGSLEQPFQNNRLMNEVAKMGGFSESTVRLNLDKNPHIILAGSGTSYSILEFFDSLDEFADFRDKLYDTMPRDIIISPSKILVSGAVAKSLVKEYGPTVLWAILRTHPNVASRLKARLIWDKSIGEDFWDAAKKTLNIGAEKFSTRDLFLKFKAISGVTDTAPIYGIVREGVIGGHVIKHGIADYSLI